MVSGMVGRGRTLHKDHRFRNHLEVASATAFDDAVAELERTRQDRVATRLAALSDELAILVVAYRAHPSGRLDRLKLRHRMEAVAAELEELAAGVDA